jgi:hypothetical protein
MDNKTLNIKTIFLQYKFKISFTLFLVILENILYLLFPLFLGFAINGLIKDDLYWLIALTSLGISDMLISSIRRFFDTRLYGQIFQDLTPGVIEKEHKKTSKVSSVSARVDMLEELIDYFEDILPEIIGSLISLGGTMIILYFLNLDIFIMSLMVLFLVMIIYRLSKKRTKILHKNLNDIKETQVDIIKENSRPHSRLFAKKVMRCYINISDLEMVNFALTFTLIIGLISASIYTIISSGIIDYGIIFSIVLYLFNFLEDVTDLPIFYQNYIRLTEIIERLK